MSEISVVSQYAGDYQVNSGSEKKGSSAMGKDMFLQILSAQLQNQDPMGENDNSAFIAQMAQFSSLEQMQNLNVSFGQMMLKQDMSFAGDLMGKGVAIAIGQDKFVSGVVEGFKLSQGVVWIHVGGEDYPVSNVIGVTDKVEEGEGGGEDPVDPDFGIDHDPPEPEHPIAPPVDPDTPPATDGSEEK